MNAAAGEQATGWEGADAPELAAEWGAAGVHLFRSVGSTSEVARRLALSGAPSGTAVLAEEQRAGRGQGGRRWASPAGLGVWMSLVLRPRSLPAPGALPLIAGAAAAEALDPWLRPASVQLKWPNDLQVGGRKLGGILCEAAWDGARPTFVVVGVGINVHHLPDDFPPDLRSHATSIRIAAGYPPPRRRIAAAVARAVLDELAEPGFVDPALAKRLAARDALAGRRVRVTDRTTREPLAEGLAMGVAPDGALLVRSDQGTVRPIRSGTVRLADRGLHPSPSTP